MKKSILTLAIQTVLLGAIPATALADQQTDIERADVAANQSQSAETQDKEAEKITVTGSRIRRDSFSFATPLVTIDRENIEDTGLGSLSEILVDEIPAIAEGVSNTNSQSSVQNTGLSTIDLRNLGTDRTLTLIDGRRVVSNSYSGNYVSLSTIPSAMVDRVEIISGGASAIYGSDAIAGVVNIITQQDKVGFELDARGGHTPEGGGREFTLDLGYGADFDNGKGYLYFGTSWDRQFGIANGDRDRAKYEASYDYNTSLLCNEMNTVDGDQCMRDITMDDWRERSDDTPGGTFESNDWFYHPTNGLTEGFVEERDGVNTYSYEMLKVPDSKLSSALKLDYELTPDTKASFQVQYSKTNSVNVKIPEGQDYNDDELVIDPVTGEPSLEVPGYISPDNPYVPQEIAESAGSSVSWDRLFVELGNIVTDNERETVRSWAGLQGSAFDNEWDWELSVGYGKFKQQQHRLNELNILNLREGLNAEYADDGVTIQCANPEARAAGCVPVNIFGYGSITPEAADYIRANPTITTNISQINLLGYMTGDLFAMPAGMVTAAFGFEYRKDKQDVQTSRDHQYGGITFNLVPTFAGEMDVKEIFAEASIPLLKDAAVAKSLSADVSLRLADYSPKGIDTMASYRTGLAWEPAEGYLVRANYARAQRAPNITELMSPPRGDYDSFSDICDGTTATSAGAGHDNCRLDPGIANAINLYGEFIDENSSYSPNAGNENLKEETADTYTFGVSISPELLDGFQLAVDYYDIEIKDAIEEIDNYKILEQCYDSSLGFGSDNPFCGDISRDSEGQLTQVLQRVFNLSEVTARGYDVALAYRYDMNDYGKLKFKLDMTHIIEHSKTFEGNDGLETINYNGELTSGIFEDVASASLAWYIGDMRIRWRTKYKGSIVDNHDRVAEWEELKADNQALLDAGDPDGIANPETPYYLYYGSYIRHDLSVSYNLEWEKDVQLRLYGGVNNLFDNQGPFVPNTGDNIEHGTGNFASDFGGGVGRFVYVGAQVGF
ncbi:TonB-dependent receptor domain-containing protein [Neptunicella sp. SCSIO 80796]|uniref:TonB-dependent receptor domain-containing protein n=1 Tax=Neptunicella plasticusilytica TaxID=3117012 RepID=UPI003A4DF4AF